MLALCLHALNHLLCIGTEQRNDLLVVPEQTQLFLANLDGTAAELGDQDLVADADAR